MQRITEKQLDKLERQLTLLEGEYLASHKAAWKISERIDKIQDLVKAMKG